MSLTINHNQVAVSASLNLSRSYAALGVSTRRLSSGLRINSAADDCAGLAVREIMRSEIRSLQQGIRNTNDAISMIQTADGALSVIDEKLIRMKELAMQAATGTYSSDQRLIIDSEFQAMASEITRIAKSTDFNGIHLLNGNLSGASSAHNGSGLATTGPMKIHFGTGNDSSEDYYYVSIDNSTASALGLGMGTASTDGKTISTQTLAQSALDALDKAIISKDKIRAQLGAFAGRLKNTVDNLTLQAENTQASEAQISDADISFEMTTFTRNQIVTQAAVAMLSQANSLSRLAMQLIGG